MMNDDESAFFLILLRLPVRLEIYFTLDFLFILTLSTKPFVQVFEHLIYCLTSVFRQGLTLGNK